MRWRLISWNVAGRLGRLSDQAAALVAVEPDVVALQEITAGSCNRWRRALADAGLGHTAFSFDLAPAAFVPAGPRRYGLILASRWPLDPLSPDRFQVPWPERVLSAIVKLPVGSVEINTTHVPPGASNGWIKVEHLEGLRGGFHHNSDIPRLLCGDFNCPRRELEDGEVITWAQREDGRPIAARGARWDTAERDIIVGLAEIGLPDVYRKLYGYESMPASWVLKRGHVRIGRRFDHVFACPQLNPVAVDYKHAWRVDGLSDHAAIEVSFDTPPVGRR